MNAELLKMPNVRHIRLLAEQATPQLLREEPPFDVLCCDMNQTYSECIERMVALAVLLRAGGLLCFTMKSHHVGKNQAIIDAELQSAVAQLTPLFDSIRTMWLWSNSERERTVIAVRARGSAAASPDSPQV
jgi:hypothetical protein